MLASMRTGIIHRLLEKYVEITSLVITYQPIVDIAIVEKTINIEAFRDFLTYCLVKKSPKAAIDIIARGGMFCRLSKVKTNLSTKTKKRMREIASMQ